MIISSCNEDKDKKIIEGFPVNYFNAVELSVHGHYCIHVMHANHADGSSILGSSG